MTIKTVTMTFNEDEIASIYWALAARNDVLLHAKNDKSRHGSLIRIDERQFERNNHALRLVEDALHQLNYS